MSTAYQPGTKPDRLAELTVTINLKAVAVEEQGGGFSIAIPALPGCVSQGETLDEARAMILEAAELWLEASHDDHLPAVAEDFTGGCP